VPCICPSHPVAPSARAIPSPPLCAPSPPWQARRCSPPLAPFPTPGAYKRTARAPSFSTPASTTPFPPSSSSIEPAPPRPSSALVSPALPSPLNSSPIIVALELHHVLAGTTRPLPPPIAPGSLTGDLPRRERPPPRCGLAIPSAFRPNWPYHRDPLPPPVPCHHPIVAEPGPRRRTAVDLTGGRA
jgi:hypothetical protein